MFDSNWDLVIFFIISAFFGGLIGYFTDNALFRALFGELNTSVKVTRRKIVIIDETEEDDNEYENYEE